jgi:hypothetical protein
MMGSISGGAMAIFSFGIVAVHASGQTPGVSPAVTFTSSNAESFASSLVAIEFSGISPEAEQQIRSLLPIREGGPYFPKDG